MLRKAAFLFVLLANVIILVHSCIPHHHHLDHLCLGQKDCHSHTAGCNPENDDHSAQPGKETDDCCQLRQIKAIPVQQQRQMAGIHSFLPSDFTVLLFSLFRNTLQVPEPLPTGTSGYVFLTADVTTAFFAEANILRGPPVI